MTLDPFVISCEPNATPGEIAVVRQGLHRFNFAATGQTETHAVNLFLREADGGIRGGLVGYVWAEWLHIEYLWMVEEYRGRALGWQLLVMAEREASRLGARGAFLNTFDFQAPEFYKRLGYEILSAIAGYPPRSTDYHLRKLFRP